jgi:hypothetical protein
VVPSHCLTAAPLVEASGGALITPLCSTALTQIKMVLYSCDFFLRMKVMEFVDRHMVGIIALTAMVVFGGSLLLNALSH